MGKITVIEWLVAISSTIIFSFAFSYFRLLAATKKLQESIMQSYIIIKNKTLSDIDKERKLQDLSIVLFTQFFEITAKLLSCLIFALTVIVIVNLSGISNYTAVFSLMVSSPFLIASTFIFFVTIYINNKKQ